MQELPFSAPCERNKSVIFDKLEPYFKQCNSVLEIGSGSAQHAVYFASRQPTLEWQTSDRAEYIDGINAQCENAGLDNVRLPFTLDVNVVNWLPEPKHYSAIYTANTLHIMDWASVSAFFNGLPSVSHSETFLFICSHNQLAFEPRTQEFTKVIDHEQGTACSGLEKENNH